MRFKEGSDGTNSFAMEILIIISSPTPESDDDDVHFPETFCNKFLLLLFSRKMRKLCNNF